MRRIHLFEFMDLSWYPQTFRRIQTDYLQFAATLGSGHKYLIPLFKRVLDHAQTMYSVQELRELTRSLPNHDYTWESGQASTGTPLFVFTYLVGYPVERR